jgi:integrase
MALTDTEIRKSRPGEKSYKLSDRDGLHMLATPSGGKLWRWKYRFEGAEKLMALGKYPEISLADARERLGFARKQLANGIDPMAERKAARVAVAAVTENTFGRVAARWLAHWKADKSPRHIYIVERRLDADLLPAIGGRPIAEIEAPELVAIAQAVQARGANEVSRRILQTCGQIFRYAISNGLAKRNPASDFVPGDVIKSYASSNQARIDAKELPALMRDIYAYQGRYVTMLAMRMMALTFVRTSELIGARWDEIDAKARRWDIPAERMKMRTPHIVPLSRQAIEVLELLRPVTGAGELLFPGDHDRAKQMSDKAIMQALEIMGYKGRMTGHGFRGLASTILHEQGFNKDHIELQLAHMPRNKVAAAYNHALWLAPRAKMMQWWGDHLEKCQRSAVKR